MGLVDRGAAKGSKAQSRGVAPEPSDDEAASRWRAARVMYLGLAGLTLSVWLASPWDFWSHTQKPFETFFTAPHMALYGGVSFSLAAVAYICFHEDLRRLFGPGLRLPLVPFGVPGPLLLATGGLLVIEFGGLLDHTWHTTLGQNEIRWSLPHGVLALGAYLAYLGFLSCRMAIKDTVPWTGATSVGFGVGLCLFSVIAYLGPFLLNSMPDSTARLATMPGQSGAAPAQAFEIVNRWNLYRTNAVYAPVAATWVGSCLAGFKAMDGRPGVFMAAAAGASLLFAGVTGAFALYVGSAAEPRTWLPPALFVAAAILVAARRLKVQGIVAEATAGGAIAILWLLFYGGGPQAALVASLAAAALPAGGWIGRRVASAVAAPKRDVLAWFVPVVGLFVPLAFGVLDMGLRAWAA